MTISDKKRTARLHIRSAREEDAKSLLAIYAPYVKGTPVTFEYEIPSCEEFASRIKQIGEKHPYLIAFYDGAPAGYAYASSFRERAAYNWCAEVSVYIREDMHHMGIGRALYGKLEELLRAQNIRNLYACITWPNPGSVAFHEALGYQIIAHFTNSGYKFNVWYDMIFMEKFINEHTENPGPFISFCSLCTNGLFSEPDKESL